MNYAIIQKNIEKCSFARPIIIEKIKSGNDKIILLNIKYKILLYPVLKFLRIDKYFTEDDTETHDIIEFLGKQYKNIAICAPADRILEIVNILRKKDVKIFLPRDNPYIVSKALSNWGITLFISPYVSADLLIYFGGDMPCCSKNTYTVDFSGKYKDHTLNTNYVKNISFGTYKVLKNIIPDIKIKGIL